MLELPCLAGAEVLAGRSGLSGVVSRLNVMEVPDILPWVKPQELLLTTGYPLRAVPESLTALVEQLAARGLAGLAVKRGRYLPDLPPAMLEEADRLGLPVIGLPEAVSFDDVINQVLDRGAQPAGRRAGPLGGGAPRAGPDRADRWRAGPPVRGARRHLRRGRHGHHPRRARAGQRRRLRAGRGPRLLRRVGAVHRRGRAGGLPSPGRSGLAPRRRPDRGRRARPRTPRRVLLRARDDRRRRAPAGAGRDGGRAGHHQGPGGLGGREQVPGRLPARRPRRPGRLGRARHRPRRLPRLGHRPLDGRGGGRDRPHRDAEHPHPRRAALGAGPVRDWPGPARCRCATPRRPSWASARRSWPSSGCPTTPTARSTTRMVKELARAVSGEGGGGRRSFSTGVSRGSARPTTCPRRTSRPARR